MKPHKFIQWNGTPLEIFIGTSDTLLHGHICRVIFAALPWEDMCYIVILIQSSSFNVRLIRLLKVKVGSLFVL